MPTPKARCALIDEYGELCRQVAEHSPIAARHRAVAATIQGWYDTFPPDSHFEAEGKLYGVLISARKSERFIANMSKLFGFLGKSTFLKHCKFSLKDVEANVTPEEQAFLSLLGSKPTGSRSLKAVALMAASK